MSRAELITEIERLRSELNGIMVTGDTYARVLEISQELDKLIVEYYRAAA